jgi:hypothetical protein
MIFMTVPAFRPRTLLKIAIVVGLLVLANVAATPLVLRLERAHQVSVRVNYCYRGVKNTRQCDVTVTDRGHRYHRSMTTRDLMPGATFTAWSVPLTGLTTSRLATLAGPALIMVIANVLLLVFAALLRMAVITVVGSAAWYRLFHRRRRAPGQA